MEQRGQAELETITLILGDAHVDRALAIQASYWDIGFADFGAVVARSIPRIDNGMGVENPIVIGNVIPVSAVVDFPHEPEALTISGHVHNSSISDQTIARQESFLTEGVGDLRFAYIRDVLIAQNREIGGKEVEVTFGARLLCSHPL